MPHMAKVKPAGVINVGLESDMKAVLTPPISVVLPAKLFTITVKTKATMFDHLSRAELFAAVFTLSQFYFRFFTYKRFSDQATWFFYLSARFSGSVVGQRAFVRETTIENVREKRESFK